MDKITYNNIEFYKIKNFPDYYISKCGKIYSSKTNKILSSKLNNKSEYLKVSLYSNKKYKKVNIHRLVAEMFIDNPNKKLTVNHKDRNKHNNNVENLEWATYAENTRYSYNLIGKKPNKHYYLGVDNPLSKKVIQYDFEGNFIKIWDSVADIDRYYNTNLQSSIIKVCKNKQKTSMNYYWKYY